MRRSTRAIRTAVVVLAAAGLTLDACIGELSEQGDSDSDEAEVIEDAASDTEPEEGDDGAGADDAEPEESGESDDVDTQAGDDAAAGGSSGTDPVADADLPGEDGALYFAEQGQVVHVVGVDHAEQLPVRGLPDPSAVEVGQLDPMAEVTLAGRERVFGDEDDDPSRWVEVELPDGVGWVDSYHLGFIEVLSGADALSQYDGYGRHSEPIGVVSEISRARAQELSGQRQVEAVLVDGRDGTQLAQARAQGQPSDGAVQARGAQVAPGEGVVQVQPALGGPDPENLWTVDFLGFDDDAVRGERVELFVVDVAQGYEVVGAWTWNICGRGLTDDGSCV